MYILYTHSVLLSMALFISMMNQQIIQTLPNFYHKLNNIFQPIKKNKKTRFQK